MILLQEYATSEIKLISCLLVIAVIIIIIIGFIIKAKVRDEENNEQSEDCK